jgi:endonuclease YncB( thermonuclease family)
MASVKLFWDPEGQQLNSLGGNAFLRITDGDTPFVSTAIRMLSIDTPEVHYPGTSDPAKHDSKFQDLADWIKAGKAEISDSLAAYLLPKLSTGRVGTLQKQQGVAATQALQQLIETKLARPSGTKRELFLAASNQPFDQYGRLLAYASPQYSADERAALSEMERATFNLMMIDSGWAASFPIFPSLPKYRDLVLLQSCAQDAMEQKRGIWAEANTLPGYEFRMCYKLWDVTSQLVKGVKLSSAQRNNWVDRYCVDMTSREIFEPADYHRVLPCNRVFVWSTDVNAAVAQLNLTPPE